MPVAPGRPARLRIQTQRHRHSVHAVRAAGRGAPCQGHRAAIDYAHLLKETCDVHFPRAEAIVLVQDNLNTHGPASLYRAFPAAEARRIAERFEWRYTPKQGSWLNMAEAEWSVLARQCLARRIPDIETLEQQVAAWLKRRNKDHVKADWRFTNKDARIKLKNLYPVL